MPLRPVITASCPAEERNSATSLSLSPSQKSELGALKQNQNTPLSFSMHGKESTQCSAKTQQHTAREVRILAPSGAVLVHRQAGCGAGGAVRKAGSHTAAESGATSL
ncbi:hypothetical protein NQZ68_008884 [Dissostichus eleginoides]|nr:hypothetical protein NQZ68_008884 [Dissostichus eleginoides]